MSVDTPGRLLFGDARRASGSGAGAGVLSTVGAGVGSGTGFPASGSTDRACGAAVSGFADVSGVALS